MTVLLLGSVGRREDSRKIYLCDDISWEDESFIAFVSLVYLLISNKVRVGISSPGTCDLLRPSSRDIPAFVIQVAKGGISSMAM